jgi:LuxR family maltose regulon positive regulatory protein
METAQGTSFGTLLKRYRVEAGLSQEALAERAHMSVRGISDLERGVRRAPYKETLSQLIDALDLTPEDRAELEAASQRFRVPSQEGRQVSDLEPSLLATKLLLPPAAAGLVLRTRLVERLEAGLQGPLTLVSAPAGCGKTTLIKAWRASPKGQTTLLAWVALEPEESDPMLFWRYVCAALDRAAPGTARASLAMLRSPQPPGMTAILTHLVNALTAREDTIVLALDDYHVIESQPIHQDLAFLLDHLPSSLRLLIASRADPPLPLSRLRARKQIVEIVAEDLSFTPDEAALYLREVMDLALSAEAIAELETRTEGWIAGLQLAALSLQGRSPQAMAEFIASFTGSHRHVVDYLADEVLARQAEPVQSFLLRTSILDRLSAPLCAFVMDGEQSQAAVAASQRLLEVLERRNVFMVPLDEERRWYRYHHLFRDALRNRLRQSPREAVSELHRRASDWHAEQGMVDDAVAHALRAGAFERVAELVDHVVWQRISRARMWTLQTWLDAVPDVLLRTRPRLCAARAYLAFISGHDHEADRYLEDAQVALRDAPADKARAIGGEIEAVQALLAVARGDSLQAMARGQDALDNLDEENVGLRHMVSLVLSTAQMAVGDLAGAARSFGVSGLRARRAGNVFIALVAEANVSFVQRAQGALHQAATTCQDALAWAAEQGNEHTNPAGTLQLNLADICREWNDLDAALEHARRANAVLRESEQVDLSVLGLLGLARVAQARGDLEGSLDNLHTARGLAERGQSAWSLALLGACEAQIWLAQGNLEAAIRWAESPLRQETLRRAVIAAAVVYRHEHRSVAPLQIFLARARASGDRAALYSCLAQIEQQRVEAERFGLRWLHLKALVQEALAFRGLGNRAEAHRALTQALALAVPEGYVRVFADEGGALAPLLHEFAQTTEDAGHVRRVLTALPSH